MEEKGQKRNPCCVQMNAYFFLTVNQGSKKHLTVEGVRDREVKEWIRKGVKKTEL